MENPMHPFDGIPTATLEIMRDEAVKLLKAPAHIGGAVFDRQQREDWWAARKAEVAAHEAIQAELDRRAQA